MPGLMVSKRFPKWYDLLEQAISSGDIDANGPMKGFPWSGSFCSDLGWEGCGDTIRALQKKFDESGFNMSILPVDPNTASLSAALISRPAVRFRDRNLQHGNVPKITQATAI
ncbi:hypothetical protein FNAPI_9688 [Fusarium napiforme]|uniref:Uncharacterized protein n=1 Tax=Fusarium napiforme TaxID=42672 RepID=A0A8H5MV04_9HYPO|nr:hypothetical protein FNAPI_9688 [Fusarium napiforme]